MTVLGVSAHYHDATAALVRDGRVVAMAAEERLSRLKHDASFPRRAIDAVLAQGGIASEELDRVVFYEEPHVKFPRVLLALLAGFPRTARRFPGAMRGWLGKRLWSADEAGRELRLPPARVTAIPHHLSHAAQAFVGAPFPEAAILVVDAVGEWACTTLGRGREDGTIELLESYAYPHSLGLFYAAFTGFLGFRPNDGEGQTMALAAFGRPTRVAEVRSVLRLHDDGGYEVDADLLDLTAEEMPFRPRFLELFGEARDHRSPLPFDALRDAGPIPAPAQAWADLAASVQLVLEEALLGLARRLRRMTGLDRLCYAGGVALNCVANARLAREGPFAELWIPPDPGDGGAAFGAAAFAGWGGGRPRYTPFVGLDCRVEDVADLLDELVRAEGRGPRIRLARAAHEEALVRETVAALAAGRVVGWLQGRFESGPRALGARSILFDPSRVDLAFHVGRAVKGRAPFRPFGLSVAAEHVPEVLDLPAGSRHTARGMQTVCAVRDPERRRGGVHVDGTTRPQVCTAEDHPLFHRLLLAWAGASPARALANTSFNAAGHPMVDGPLEALAHFVRSEMDVLVMGDCVLSKEDRA